MRASIVVVALVLTGCEVVQTEPTVDYRAAETQRIVRLATPAVSPEVAERARGADDASLAQLLAERCSPSRANLEGSSATESRTESGAAFAFSLGAEGFSQDPAALIARALPADAPPEVVAAAAMGLGMCKTDATEGALVGLALRPSHPPEAVEALFSYYRMRGADKTPPSKLPDARLLEFADHNAARGRAAIAHLGRAVKDPALIPALVRLARDADFEVRRAAAMALADGVKTKRSAVDRERCIDVLTPLFKDDDAHVVASTCRSVATYVPPSEVHVQLLVDAATHADFNVRVAALESLGALGAAEGFGRKPYLVQLMTRIAGADDSTSVRYTAAAQLAKIDSDAALLLVDTLLRESGGMLPPGPIEPVYVRTAAAAALGAAAEGDENKKASIRARLAGLAKNDPHVRVREAAVAAFEGKKNSPVAKEAIRAALEDKDVGVVSAACGVVAKNGWTDMAWLLSAVPARFPGCYGADARESAISALSDLDVATDRMLFESHRHDSNPAVRAAAEQAIAKLDKTQPPKNPTRGADLTGELLPGGAPIFDEEVYLVVETFQGTMRIRLFPDQAPVHCAHIVALARRRFYDGLTWHRVVPDFVIQGGCPRGDGSGNAGVTLPHEPTRIPFERGTLGMPRSDHPDTGGCQLFICHSRAPHLDVRYTAFGKVVDGLDVIDKIDVDTKILRVTVEGAR
jgi:cyclophilin family peptidyl-prolyl cis-trans isomerase